MKKIGQMTIPEEIASSVEELETQLKKIESVWKKLQGLNLDSASKELDHLETARLSFVLAYSLNTLYRLLLQTEGQYTEDHPVVKDLERIQQHYQMIDRAANPEKYKDNEKKRKLEDAEEKDATPKKKKKSNTSSKSSEKKKKKKKSKKKSKKK